MSIAKITKLYLPLFAFNRFKEFLLGIEKLVL